jgi:serine/arginine repetitive matrix protein 2
VNGLRDDDLESVYASRTSLTSEYSMRDNTEGLQVFVKEHGRSTSKGSGSSFLSRKKPSQSKNRPETKVNGFPSSSNVINAVAGFL